MLFDFLERFFKSDFFMAGGGTNAYEIGKSLRFRSSASAYLSRLFSTPTTQNTYSLSLWVKRGQLGAARYLFGASTNYNFGFNASDQILLTVAGTAYTSTATFRDPAAHYHIQYTHSGTTYTVYVNGVSVMSGTSVANTVFNSAVTHQLGAANTANYFDGYMSEINFVDGQVLDPSYFGQTDSTTGSWTPKKYTGTYGTNGFYLPFSDGTSTTTLGSDESGNGNDWTLTNFSLTSGVTYDWMEDTPTDNFAGLNPLDANSVFTITGANNTFSATVGTTNNYFARSSFAVSSGQWYWEVTPSNVGVSPNMTIGIQSTALSVLVGAGTVLSSGFGYYASGVKYNNSGLSAYGASYAASDVVGVAYDASNGTIEFYKNGVSQGVAFTGITGEYTPLISINVGGVSRTIAGDINFGQRPFAYTPPSGYKALSASNLPTPAIKRGDNYFAANTRAGTGAAFSVTGKRFQPDLVWSKGRSGATDHALYDSARGVQNQLESNTTTAETVETAGVTAFNSDGFSGGALAQLNTNAATYVDWLWRVGGAASTNTDGTISSQVSANLTAGVSIATYTGTLTGVSSPLPTVGHGLGAPPQVVISKSRSNTGVDSGNWFVWHKSTGTDYWLRLNTTDTRSAIAASGGGAMLDPTSTVFSTPFISGANINANSYVAYCFTEVAGFSKISSYIGNGSAVGPFVWCGFRPRWVLIKRTTTAASDWYIYDAQRDTVNAVALDLNPNSATAETSTTALDILSNGFKVRQSASGLNASGDTYVFMAFAETPFKYANAR